MYFGSNKRRFGKQKRLLKKHFKKLTVLKLLTHMH